MTTRWNYANREKTRTKYAALWHDQLDDLRPLARDLQDAKAPEAPRITENTLLRVATDVLLQYRELLVGSTEEELRANLLNNIQVRPTPKGDGAPTDDA